MKRIAVALLSVSLLAACSSDPGSSPTTSAAGSPESSPDGGTPAPVGAIDPAATEGCSILTPEQMASIFGSAEGQWNPNSGRTDVAECQWYASDGRSISFQIDLVNLPSAMFLRAGESVGVGNEAYSQAGDFPRLEADLHGWYVLIYGLEGKVTTDDTLALATMLDGLLSDRPGGSGDGGDGGDDGSTDGSDGGDALGTLTDMSVTIDEPADIAGTMTFADLQAGGSSLMLCGGPWTLNSLGKMFVVSYTYGIMSGGASSPTPVVSLSVAAEGEYTGPGTYAADMSFATDNGAVSGVGSMTINDDQLSGTFTYGDASGTVNGHWTCAGS